MRLGRVEFTVSYVVDLDSDDMVAEAKELITEDIDSMSGEERYALISIEHAHPDDTIGDIHPVLLGEFDDNDFEENE
jgi:hypothetical protein